MAQSLFLFTIGPVQDLIASARRTRDLWFGSYLLSRLSRRAAGELVALGGELIFPTRAALKDQNRDTINRIIAELPDGAVPVEVGQTVERAVRTFLDMMAQRAFARAEWPQDSEADQRRAQQQIADLIEVAWVAVPRTEDYVADRSRLEALMTARRTTRDVPQIRWGAPIPKSSIDGARESVIPESLYPSRRETPEEIQRTHDELFRRFRAKAAERLSGVDLLKRLGLPVDQAAETAAYADFPSTSHFAALPFLRRVAPQGVPTAVITAYADALSRLGAQPERLALRYRRIAACGDYDASLLFSERLAEEVVEARLPAAQQALATCFQRLGAGLERPEPYYALLLADGDNMGKVINALGEIAEHRRLSDILDGFAGGVRGLVESADMRGALVYAGGDDVLAFFPVDTVLRCAHALEQAFARAMEELRLALPAQTQARLTHLPTLSVGIVIVHHLAPLADALALARRAEQLAKGQPGKHALAITLSKRSSGDRSIVGAWSAPLFDRLNSLITLHRADAIPDGAAYELRHLAERVGTLPAAALQAEALRIITRKQGQHGKVQADGALATFAQQLPVVEARPDERRWDVMQFADELIIARTFARASGPLPKDGGR